MSELKITVENGKEFQIKTVDDNTFNINGSEASVDWIELKDGKFNLIHQNQSYNAEVVAADEQTKEFTIKVNNNDYQLKVEDRFDLLLHQLGMDSLAGAGFTELKAPMPGLVLKLEVEAGQAIKKDEPLVVLEAMKMENVLKSPADTTIKSIAVEVGQAVEKNQLLIEFES